MALCWLHQNLSRVELHLQTKCGIGSGKGGKRGGEGGEKGKEGGGGGVVDGREVLFVLGRSMGFASDASQSRFFTDMLADPVVGKKGEGEGERRKKEGGGRNGRTFRGFVPGA